ncbi:hypothetical protein rpr22_CDSx478 [Rickettsia prowazekii str. Rp22]|uniref:Uncharacterized protein n=1 Tax=Rickettsia prowazekii (strain Rp22) TaxID=449216 RepID=D5AX36_RICPP|nr:hypothetical protein rpr22_CDSx478 [Rickettsia prowazekii str. Rp22]
MKIRINKKGTTVDYLNKQLTTKPES